MEILHIWLYFFRSYYLYSRILRWGTEYHICKSTLSAHGSCIRVWPTFPKPRAMLTRMTLADNANIDGAGTNLNINGSAKDVFLRMLVFTGGVNDKCNPLGRQPISLSHIL